MQKSGIHSWTLDEEHSRAILKRGLELGVNFFDTAAGYQSRHQRAVSGTRAERFCKNVNEVVVATKFFPRSPQEIADGVSGKRSYFRSSRSQPYESWHGTMLTFISAICGTITHR